MYFYNLFNGFVKISFPIHFLLLNNAEIASSRFLISKGFISMILIYTCVSINIVILTCRNMTHCILLQVCLEGQISRKSVLKSLSEGHQPFGDQLPWKFSEQFRDTVFPSLSGARIVRIATHPSAMRVNFCLICDLSIYLFNLVYLSNVGPLQLGYGSAAVELLTRYMHFPLLFPFLTLTR